jgi:AAA+ ATPase superfamily predicted ATPase
MDDTNAIARSFDLRKIYNLTASISKWFFYFLTTAQLIVAASLPAVALISPKQSSPIKDGLLGATLLVLQGLQQTFRFEKKWIQNRVAVRVLKSDEQLYCERAGPYRNMTDEEARITLVERTEKFANLQNEQWKDLMEATFQGDKHHPNRNAKL